MESKFIDAQQKSSYFQKLYCIPLISGDWLDSENKFTIFVSSTLQISNVVYTLSHQQKTHTHWWSQSNSFIHFWFTFGLASNLKIFDLNWIGQFCPFDYKCDSIIQLPGETSWGTWNICNFSRKWSICFHVCFNIFNLIVIRCLFCSIATPFEFNDVLIRQPIRSHLSTAIGDWQNLLTNETKWIRDKSLTVIIPMKQENVERYHVYSLKPSVLITNTNSTNA